MGVPVRRVKLAAVILREVRPSGRGVVSASRGIGPQPAALRCLSIDGSFAPRHSCKRLGKEIS
jgi:hypothetical protein